ncbi:DUF998 domain-containing protein [archaeon]|nr:DUF998 domain-containing protein [archaeon]
MDRKMTVGFWSGLIAAFVFIVFVSLAIANYPNYNPHNNYLSDLGTGPSSVFFNSGVIIAGLLGIIFSFFLRSAMKNRTGKEGAVIFAVASIALIGVGIFPGSTPLLHHVFSGAFFILDALAIIVIGISVKGRFGYFSVVVGILSGIYIPTGILPIIEHVAVFSTVLWTIVAAFYARKILST